MRLEDITRLVTEELKSAEEKHPVWPNNPFEALAVLTEEVGELNQAVLDAKWDNGDPDNITKEAVQVIAMGYRFLKNFDVTMGNLWRRIK